MFKVPNYQITDTVYTSKNTCILRGTNLTSQQPVVIKTTAGSLQSVQQVNKLRHEFAIGQQINSVYIVKMLELVQNDEGRCFLIEEDDNSITLDQFSRQTDINLQDFLQIAIQLTQGLLDIHQSRFIHQDIKPSNVIIQSHSKKLKFIDFSNATPLRQISQSLESSHLTEGSLQYASPEQTGRMNRTVDYRTDFYSLGVTLYQLLCGKLPFEMTNALDLVYAHLALLPQAPHELNSKFPVPVSAIIMKLLSKNAENRYQTVQGILIDLKKCLSELTETGSIRSFALNQEEDVAEFLLIPQKLYGREQSQSLLLDSFEQVCQGQAEIVMITGPAGIGKTALANELKKYSFLKKGHFIHGKFEQFNRDVAYSAITHALQGFIKRVLTESEENLLHWKNRLLTVLGSNAQLMVDFIPELALIVGELPPVLALEASVAKNRLNMVLQNFIQVLIRPEQPLVLFLDDLQWADTASLALIESLIKQAEMEYFLLVGVYRSTEIETQHPIQLILEKLQKAGAPIRMVELSPLSLEQLNEWLAETLHLKPDKTRSLAEVVYSKTGGNPFFMRSFIQTLYDKQLLRRESSTGWQWELEKISQYPATENVIELMLCDLKQIEPAAQAVLKCASCIGYQFEASLLQALTQIEQEALYQSLQTFIASGLLIVTEDNFSFSHDRIQEAAYALLSDEDKACQHLAIGRCLLAKAPAEPSQEQLFEIMNQFNKGISLVSSQEERWQVARLNLQAAQKAKATAAYQAALQFIESALHCFNQANLWIEHLWDEDYAYAYALYKELAELAYLNGHLERSATTIDWLLTHTKWPLERAEIYNLLLAQKTLAEQYSEAIAYGYQALHLFGIDISTQDLPRLIAQEAAQVKTSLQGKTREMLLAAPNLQDPEQKAIIKLLHNMIMPGIYLNPVLGNLYSILLVKRILEYGNMPEAATAYVHYGRYLSITEQAYDKSYEFARLAIDLSEKFNDNGQKCKCCAVMVARCYIWSKSSHTLTPWIEEGIRAGLSSGELLHVGFLCFAKIVNFFDRGLPLTQISQELIRAIKFSQKMQNPFVENMLLSLQITIENLMQKTPGSAEFQIDVAGEEAIQQQRSKNPIVLTFYHIRKAQVLYLHECFELALQEIQRAETYLENMAGFYETAIHNWYYSLTLTALYQTASAEQKRDYLQQIEKNQAQLKIWSEHCPENFLHKYKLVAAEIARISQDNLAAIKLYDEAIILAQRHQFTQEEALANELAARFWMAQNITTYAQGRLIAAYRGYQIWGGKRKTDGLVNRFSALLQPFLKSSPSGFCLSEDVAISGHILAALDIASVLKASQLIASELDMPKLFANIMQVIIHNAGAQRGALIIKEADSLVVQAEFTPEQQIKTMQAIPLSDWTGGAHSIINYVKRTQQTLLIGDALSDKQFEWDTHSLQHEIRSVLCVPIIKQRLLKAILYLENNLTPHAFTQEHVHLLTILSGQMAMAIENARAVQAQLAIAQQMAEQQQKRAEEAENFKKNLEAFIGKVCHEIRNPLQGIYGNVEIFNQQQQIIKTLLSQPYSVGRDQNIQEAILQREAAVAEIEACAKHQKNIVNNTLDLSELETDKVVLNKQPCWMKPLLQESIAAFQPQLDEKKLALKLQLPEIEPQVKIDAEQLKRIITQLVSNAIRYTERGEITLALSYQDTTPTQTSLQLVVKDTGVGMRPEEQAQLFKRFSPAKYSSVRYEQAGFGLAICKRLIDLMDGQLTVSSEKWHGSEFTIVLPCEVTALPEKQVPLPSLSVSTPGAAMASITPKKVLIVEDNIINLKVLARMVQQAGHSVHKAENGLAAVQFYEEAIQQQAPVDLILMDLEMPVMGGLEATRRIRQREDELNCPSIPIIAVTGNPASEFKAETREAGMNDYLTKPCTKSQISAIIARWTSSQPERAVSPEPT